MSAPTLAQMTLEEKLGQLIMVRYDDREILAEMLAHGYAGSFYFGQKGQPAEAVATELNRLQALAKVPALVAFGFACADCGTGMLKGNMMRLGATRDADLVYRMAYAETREQRAYGYHIPGLPVLDVNLERTNPIINTRAFGDDVQLVTELGVAALRGVMDARGVTCAMHFPGHGSTKADSHIRLPVDDRCFEDLWSTDLTPYREAIRQGVINGLCTSHVHYPCLNAGPPAPATISRKIVTHLLRGRLSYDGLIMSDSLTMKPMKDAYGIEEAAILTVLSGHDLILFDYASDPRITHAALVEAARSGRIPLEQIDASAARVLKLKEWLGLFEDRFTDLTRIAERVGTPELKALALEIARQSVTVLENAAVPLRVSDPSRCLVIVNGSDAVWNEDMEYALLPTHERLHRAIKQRLPQARTLTLSEQMTPEELAAALAQANEAETVIFGLFTRVVCYHEDSIGLRPQCVDLIREVAATDMPLALLNFGNPYLMSDLPRASATLCTYDEVCPESIEAAVEVLFGETKAQGKLPVRVSEKYPFGHGLS